MVKNHNNKIVSKDVSAKFLNSMNFPRISQSKKCAIETPPQSIVASKKVSIASAVPCQGRLTSVVVRHLSIFIFVDSKKCEESFTRAPSGEAVPSRYFPFKSGT